MSKKDQAELDAEELLDSLDYNGSHNKLIANTLATKLRGLYQDIHDRDYEIEKLRGEIKRLHKVGIRV